MGMRGTYHKDRILELVENFKGWREERVPGVRAFQSRYDRYELWQGSFDGSPIFFCSQGGYCDLQMAIPNCARHQSCVGFRLYSSTHGELHPLQKIIGGLACFQPELFRFTEGAFPSLVYHGIVITACLVNDNDELANRASVLLGRMCGVTPPRAMVDSILDAMFTAIEESPVRHHEMFSPRMLTCNSHGESD